MEKRDYFTAPFPQEMSLRGGIHATRRQPGTSISGSDVISSLFNPKLPTSRWTIFKNLIKFPSRSTVEDNPDPHFLDSCFHCKRPLRRDRDIFMYRGDIPFCSEECREEEIKSDELKERRSVFLRAVASRKGGKNSSMKSVEIHAAGPAVAG